MNILLGISSPDVAVLSNGRYVWGRGRLVGVDLSRQEKGVPVEKKFYLQLLQKFRRVPGERGSK